MNIRKLLVLLASVISLSLFNGCTDKSTKNIKLLSKDPEELYNTGLKDTKAKDIDGIAQFDALQQAYPRSQYIENSYVLKTYLYYVNDKFEDTISTVDVFNLLYENSKYSAYMHYMKAMAYYKQLVDQGRDQHITEEAIYAFTELMTRYPNSEYAKDGKWKFDYTLNLLAAKEMEIGRFYSKRDNTVAAINRFKTVVDFHSNSIFIPEALYRLTVAYIKLGLRNEAVVYASVLGHNFYDTKWYTMAYNALEKDNLSQNRLENKTDKDDIVVVVQEKNVKSRKAKTNLNK